MTMQSNTLGNGAQFITKKLQKDFQKQTRTMSKFRQFRSLVINQGLNKGVEANWVVAGTSSPQPPMAEGGSVPVQDTLSNTGSCVIQHFISGTQFTKKLSQVTELDLKAMVEDDLAIRCAKSIEIYSAVPAFRATNLKVLPKGGNSLTDIDVYDTTVTGAVVAVNAAPLTIDHMLAMSVEASERNIETKNGELFFIARPRVFTKFRKQLEQISQHTAEGYKNIVNGSIGKYDNINVVEQTTVDALGWTGSGVAGGQSDEGFLFGANSIVEVLVDPEHIIANSSVNWGQDLGLAYTTLVGHSLLRKDKILHWTSAS